MNERHDSRNIRVNALRNLVHEAIHHIIPVVEIVLNARYKPRHLQQAVKVFLVRHADNQLHQLFAFFFHVQKLLSIHDLYRIAARSEMRRLI